MVNDYGQIEGMEEIAVSKFKATCLSVLQRVQKTRKPVLITRFGKPIAEVVPPPPPPRQANWLGCMVGTGEIVGDIIAPAAGEEEWDVLRK
jgi:prevent-host-death family protein